MKFRRIEILICIGLFFVSGCGSDLPPIGSLTGTLMLDGKPYANGSLMFTPTGGGRPSVAATDENGKFEAMYNADTEGALIGTHTVTFEPGVPETSEEDEFKPYSPPDENFTVAPNQITVEAGGTEVNLTLEQG